jgi:penicillin-binding protein 1A
MYITSLGVIGLLMGLLAAYLYVWPQLPDVESLKEVHLQTPMRIFTRDGALIAEFGEKRRIPVSIEEIPEPLNQALIATEDQRFYEHGGVDFLGLARAGIGLVTSGRIQGGGSTITMQLARNFFLSFDQTFTRKIKEIFLSWKIEHALDKRHILELYWNKINFGHRAYGVGAAAEVYYGKKVQDLSLPELATIAGIPKGPSTHNPISNPDKALNRRNHVLRRMLEEGFIDEQTYRKAIQAPQTAVLRGARVEVYAPYLAEMVRRDMIDRFGLERAYNDGMTVVTTLLARDQRAARRALREGLVAYDQRHGYRGPEAHLPEEQLADRTALEQYLSDIPEFGFLWPAVVTRVEDKQAVVLLRRGRPGHFEYVEQLLPWDALSWARPYDPDGGWTAPPKSASEILRPGDLVRVFAWKDGHLTLAQIPQANGAFVALDAQDGAIRALEGGFDFDLSKFNRVTQARRQPG